MGDLRDRFAKLGWQPMPDDWDGIVRRAERLAGAPATVGLGDGAKVRRVVRAVDHPEPRWLGPRLNPTARVILIFVLLSAIVAGSFAFGAWYRDWRTVAPPSAMPPSAPPLLTVVQPCPGMRTDLELVDTTAQGNDTPDWQPGTSNETGDGRITATRFDSSASVGAFLIDPGTGSTCRLVDLGSAGLLPWELRWSPDGSSLAIVNQVWAASGEAHVLVWSGLGDAATLTRPWIGSELPGIAWSPNSREMALAGSRSVTILGADGREPRVLPCEPCRSATRVAWSPDGTQLAIRTPSADGPIGTTEIQLVDVSNGALRRLDVGSERLDLIAWLDASRLLLIDHATDRVLEVSIASPGEFATRDLVRLDDGTAYVVSPDLTQAAFVADAQRSDERLVVVDLADNARTTLVRSADLGSGQPIGDIAWSPDDRTLALSQVTSGEELPLATAIWTVDVGGGGLRQVTHGPFDLLDGRYIGSGLDLGSWRPGSP